jgi:hypothetical protein
MDNCTSSIHWMRPPPPRQPPPPPRVGTGRGSSSSGTVTVSFDQRIVASNGPPPIRVASAVQARKLISKVDPEAPADWPEEPPMRFVVVIGNDGRIGREIWISGNPWLAQTAVASRMGLRTNLGRRETGRGRHRSSHGVQARPAVTQVLASSLRLDRA